MNNSNANDINEYYPAGRAPLVLIIGPPEQTVGGMATVVTQQRSLTLDDRYDTAFFAITLSSVEGESLFLRLVRHARHLIKLIRTIQRHNPSIVHIHTCSGFSFYRNIVDLLVAKMSACTVVLHIHGAAFDDFYRSRSSFGKRAIRWSLAQADRVIALSQRWEHLLISISPRARIVVIENAVQAGIGTQEPDTPCSTPLQKEADGALHKQAPLPLQLSASNQPCRFLMLARMDTWKGVDDLLDALAHLRNGIDHEPNSIAHSELYSASLCCDESLNTKNNLSAIAFECTLAGPAGSAGDQATLNRKIADRSLGAYVQYVGSIHGKQKEHWLSWADTLVQPSHHEGMPIAMLEALAIGLPVVATKVGAVPEVITDYVEGLLIAPHSPIELSTALHAIANDVTLREKLGRAARQLAITRFGLDRLDADLVRLYDDLITTSDRDSVQEDDSAPRSTQATINYIHAAHSA